MKQLKKLFLLLTVTAVIFTCSANASAQVLDDTWFELNITIKGTAVDLKGDGSVTKEGFKTTAYMYLYWDETQYDFTIFCEVIPGVWREYQLSTLDVITISENSTFMHDIEWEFRTPDGYECNMVLNGLVKTKLDKNTGDVKSASFSPMGIVLLGAGTPDAVPILGSAKLKGKMIPVDKLPFTPPSP